jgi:hypothetical protein
MVKRRRSSESEYIAPDDSKEVWGCTSKWRDYQLTVLKLKVVDGTLGDITCGGKVELGEGLEGRILLPSLIIDGKSPPPYLTDSQKNFYRRVVQVSESKDEPPVDMVIFELLDASKFESDKLHFRPRPHLEIEWRNKRISSEPDFGIYSDESRKDDILEYMMVVEAKRFKVNSLQPERQLCGEMLVASCERSISVMDDQEIFGMVVRGNLIRFYKTTFTKNYLIRILENGVPDEDIRIMRYPPSNEKQLSLINPEDRLEIANILSSIRERIMEQI